MADRTESTQAGLSPKEPMLLVNAPKSSSLEAMRDNPKGNWTIKDIETACGQLGMACKSPSSGSHYKVSSEKLDGIFVIPARRPIKVCYIKQFISMANAYIKSCRESSHE